MTNDQERILDYIFMRLGELETPDRNRHYLSLIADTLIVQNADDWISHANDENSMDTVFE